MKEIIEALSARIRSPLFGYYALSVMVINWKPMFNLLFSKKSTLDRILYFDTNTDFYSLVIYPLISSAFIVILYPWLNYLFLIICKKPTDLRNTIQAQSEHSLLIKKQEMEQLSSSLLSGKETELIERAKRDIELKEIENTEVREKLISEIEELRKERDSIGTTNNAPNRHKEIMNLIKEYKEKSVDATNRGDANNSHKYWAKAMDLQEKLATGTYDKPNK